MAPEALLQKVKDAPKSTGCYMFSDRMGDIVYVGKAERLSFSCIDGKGLLPGILLVILTVELYRLMKQKNFARINLPPNVPASLSEVFTVSWSGGQGIEGNSGEISSIVIVIV